LYDWCAAVLVGGRREPITPPPPVDHSWWVRLLEIEGCAAALGAVVRGAGRAALSDDEQALLTRQGDIALRNALTAVPQLQAIARVACRAQIPFLVLKGGARILSGETAGARQMSDLDLLVAAGDAARLHALLMRQLEYTAPGGGSIRHLPALVHDRLLPVEIHVQLRSEATTLDRSIWDAPRPVPIGTETLYIPSASHMAIHTLEHAVIVHAALRYRLRDIVDVASVWAATPSPDDILAHVRRSRCRGALETLLSAAHDLEPAIPLLRARAWKTVRRVALARLTVAGGAGTPYSGDAVVRLAGQVAEGSPRVLAQLAWKALRRPLSAGRQLRSALTHVG